MATAGPLRPVVTSSVQPAGGAALRVVASASVPAGEVVDGGPAMPVYVVSQAEIAAGTFSVQGNEPVPVVAVTPGGSRVVDGGPAIPIVIVSGSL